MWEIVIGLETHVELSTKSKIFCGCTTAFGGDANTHVCPVCSGMPGTLPVLNRAVVDSAIKTGITLNCSITTNCKFDRKNYFYPDLPKAYQVSQLYVPICCNGHLDIESKGQKKTIRIREIHMEEDAGKLVHDSLNGGARMDFNRCGVPLLEIVTQPDFQSEEEVLAYLEKLREILLYLGVSDCKMQEGSLRADINLSVRKPGEELGVRTEMKNLNSFKAIGRAIKHEAARQIEILSGGGRILQETRRWDDDKGISYGMRSKENAQEYRYFPEPDLLPMHIDDAWLASIKSNLPELAQQKRERYVKVYGLSEYEASVLTVHKNISDLFEDISETSGEPVEAAHLVTGEIMRLISSTNTLPEGLSLDAKKLSVLISLVSNGKINRNSFKEVIEAVFMSDVEPQAYIEEKGLMMLNDSDAVMEMVNAVLSENPGPVSEYRAGKEKAFGFLMGQAMRRLGGTGNPDIVRKALKEKLQGKGI
ncbi:MAG: Asp-tRNA(Asn)/Glu-tRNA(Gln) amidotransferase subunit GatB [Fibromonadaceae bacterium]|jgi:aspartyl-tRNA(Asn)/glutamyl-tRNA(Gln) amidotransferase subunit B|nr:Asp-tRNA(Asn)/Glu-tRNA(Gln) amidotransferase subunit GatB [Fibromonadaceae bacterium]